jgi:hypothetical protein
MAGVHREGAHVSVLYAAATAAGAVVLLHKRLLLEGVLIRWEHVHASLLLHVVLLRVPLELLTSVAERLLLLLLLMRVVLRTLLVLNHLVLVQSLVMLHLLLSMAILLLLKVLRACVLLVLLFLLYNRLFVHFSIIEEFLFTQGLLLLVHFSNVFNFILQKPEVNDTILQHQQSRGPKTI